MRSFEQYINEARQNYIFGGTDNRNTDIKEGKPFSKLKEGDKLYIWCDNAEDEVEELSFRASYSYETNKEHVEIDTIEDEPLYINARDFDSDVSYGESKNTKWCVATTFEVLQDTVHGVYKVKIDKNNILSL